MVEEKNRVHDEDTKMVHLTNFGPSTAPVPPAPGPLLRFIQQAQLALVYGPRT